ncbi:MAG: ferrochelatase [Marinosulfonomonas sp.]|nr:MAG: ferrochelatase [Marinosulfonomonas sp.]
MVSTAQIKTRSKSSAMAETGKTGVLLVNLGTPEATDYRSMRRYLKQFLSDKRVVEASGPIWWLVLNGIILRKRPKASGRAYDLIWNNDLDESPLKTVTRAQSDAIAQAFSGMDNVVVDWAMRYGEPSIDAVLKRMVDQGCTRILLFPLYPQYSGATTGTAMDNVFDVLKSMRHQPTIRTVAPYYNHPAHIIALADSIRAHHATLDWTPDVTIASLHGLPVDFIKKGDPYQDHCEATVALLRQELGYDDRQLLLTYQSRSGRTVWMTPDTEDVAIGLARDGVKNLTIIAPGFATDCIETLEELHIRAHGKFIAAGGENCSVVPCLNDSPPSISMLKTLVDANLGGWV